MSNIEAAREYARRCRKGLPEDRWSNGTDGARAVAQGIDELDWLIAWAYAEIERLNAEKVASGLASMEATKDPCRG